MLRRLATHLLAAVAPFLGCTPFVDPVAYARGGDAPCAPCATVESPREHAYEIPADAPRGQLMVEPPTMTALAHRPGVDDDVPLHALEVVVVLTNRSDEVWFLDRDEQVVDVSTAEQCVALAALTPARVARAAIEVRPHTENWISLYFDLPPSFRGQDAALFQVMWVVHTGARRVAGSTTFDLLTRAGTTT